MEAKKLVKHLDEDFIKPYHLDDWTENMSDISDYLTETFKEKQMWLVCDFTEEINKIFSAVFPSKKVMQVIIDSWIKDAMLFLHHPMIWDIRERPVFKNMDKKLLEIFKQRNISIYALHVPLDDFWDYSTSNSLTKALDINFKKVFLEYYWSMAWVIGEVKSRSLQEIKQDFEKAVWHEVKLYDYSNWTIKNNTVALVAGGWLTESIQEIADNDIKLLITGISNRNSHSEKAHQIAENYWISILGGTHYSTEKFACQNMVNYFKKIWIDAEFIEDSPVLEDM